MPWTSCCRDRRRNCPSIRLASGFLLIRDDDGVVVKIKTESIGDLVATIQDEVQDGHVVGAPVNCARY
jgi:hypothetical protein